MTLTRIPLTIVAPGGSTDGVLVGVMATELDALETEAENWHRSWHEEWDAKVAAESELERMTTYAECLARGLSDSEARGTAWPTNDEAGVGEQDRSHTDG